MKLKHHSRFIALVLFAAWLFDFFFWKQQAGITVPIYILVLISAGLVFLYGEGYRPAWQSMVLIVPITFFAIVFAVRLEPFTQFAAFLLIFTLLAGMALTLRSGFWVRYSLSDWFVGFFRIGWGALSGGTSLRHQKDTSKEVDNAERIINKNTYVSTGKPILYGLFLALPIVLLFGWILAIADPVFARLMNEWIAIEQWPEYMLRGIFILILAYMTAGVYLFMLFKSNHQKLIGVDAEKRGGVIGGIEATTILACINLLFAVFVGVQFTYFFGGQSNINLEGFTYAEYARRGFFELVFVAVLSLMLFFGLGALAHRKNAKQRRMFSSLGIVLVGLLGIILYSAFLRLSMYEMAYGFSRLRAYTHVFMVWLGVLLFLTAILEVLRKSRGFASALLFVSIGFTASLAIINVDAFIVKQNVARTQSGYELDVYYLTGLSDDAVPALAELYSNEQNPEIRAELGAVLLCKDYQAKRQHKYDWRSYHIARANARSLLEQYHDQLSQYRVIEGRTGVIIIGEKEYECYLPLWRGMEIMP
jgi:hypothetical protein